MLQLTAVQKSYGSTTILDIPDLELRPGVYWLQGPNGSGKTTFLRLLAGILPFGGEIRLYGRSLKNEAVAYRRAIGWAEAEPLYPDFLTGKELLAFYSDILHPPAGQAEDLVRRFEMASWLDSKAGGWSSGMAKKMSLLLAFLGRPSLILLDEPLVTLDQSGLDTLNDLVRERSERDGTGFILSSHQSLVALGVAGMQIMQLADGAIYII